MKAEATKAELWNHAGTAGLALGLVSTAYMFITQHISGISSSFLLTFVTFLLWAVKFGGCIWLMFHFMKRFRDRHEKVSYHTLTRFGIATALCSALVYSGATLANILIVSPELYETAFDTVIQSYGTLLDSNSMAMVEKMQDKFPQIAFFSNLIYCFLYGSILSPLLSRAMAAKDIMGILNEIDNENDNNNQEQ